MENRITELENGRVERSQEPQPIGRVLLELLAQYQARFQQLRVTVVNTPAMR